MQDYNQPNSGCFFTQQLFLIGTKNEDGTDHFAPISWVSYTWGLPNCLVISISSHPKKKQTTANIERNKFLSATVVTPDLLPFVEQCNKSTSTINESIRPVVVQGNVLDVSLIQNAKWSYECEMIKHEIIGECETFFCAIRYVNVREDIKQLDFVDLRVIDPVIYSPFNYFNVGEHLGKIGDYSHNQNCSTLMPNRLKNSDTIGIIAPCHLAIERRMLRFKKGIEDLGFNVKLGKNIYKDTYGFAASTEERLSDFNDMIFDENVKMVLFSGGNIGNDFLNDLDFDSIRENKKIYCSYSGGTSLLNIIYLNTNLETYYGQCPGVFDVLNDYDRQQFLNNFINQSTSFVPNSPWVSITDGVATGVLVGGYTTLISQLVYHPLFKYDKNENYILFLENLDVFTSVPAICAELAWIEQSPFMKQVTGLLFGNYAKEENQELIDALKRFGTKNRIPILKCDDFGHGDFHGILPIGRKAQLNSERKSLIYLID